MNYDTLTLSAVLDELQPLLDGRVQRVLQVDPLTLVLELYAGYRYQLLLSANATLPRVLLAEDKARRGVETPSPFFLLLVKHLRGASLVSLRQPPYERVLELGFSGAESQVTLIAELMGRYSNLILVDNQRTVMDAVKRIPPSLNRYRSTLPHQPYVAPPAQAKLLPADVTPAILESVLGSHLGEAIWRVLVDNIAGISPLLGREIVYRAFDEPAAAVDEQKAQVQTLYPVFEELINLPQTHTWQASIALDEEGQVTAFAPYVLTHLGKSEPAASISTAINRYLEGQVKGDAYRAVRTHLHGLLNEQQAKVNARLNSLQEALLPEDQIEALQRRANAILALGWSLSPGQAVLELEPEMAASLLGTDINEIVRIQLDPTLTPSGNAEKLFDQYRRKKAANAQVPALVAAARNDLAYLEQLALDIDLAADRNELNALQKEIETLSGSEQREPNPRARKSVLTVNAGGRCIALVGRSARQNEEVTFKRAAPDDLWLHAHGVPGAHVILKCGREEPPGEALETAARYAAYYSGQRGESTVLVDYTRRRYVVHIAGGRPGMVNYRRELTIAVPGTLPEPENAANASR